MDYELKWTMSFMAIEQFQTLIGALLELLEEVIMISHKFLPAITGQNAFSDSSRLNGDARLSWTSGY